MVTASLIYVLHTSRTGLKEYAEFSCCVMLYLVSSVLQDKFDDRHTDQVRCQYR